MTATPLLDRIKARRDRRVGPVSPVPTPISQRMSEFSRRLAEKRLPNIDRTGSYWLGSYVPDGDGGAA